MKAQLGRLPVVLVFGRAFCLGAYLPQEPLVLAGFSDLPVLIQEQDVEMFLFELFKREIYLGHEIRGGIGWRMERIGFFEDADVLAYIQRLSTEVKGQLIWVIAFTAGHILL